MAIRFACPSCRQPIEIDDQWAGQSVGCPYCQQVVTAPQQSEWPAGDIPVASPAGGAFEPPPPPGAAPASRPAPPMPVGTGTGGTATWAFALAMLCAVLSLVAWMAAYKAVQDAMLERDPRAFEDPEVFARVYREILIEPETVGVFPTSPTAIGLATLGILVGLGGVVLAARSLLRREPRRGLAIAAVVVGTCFLFCQMPVAVTGCLPELPPAGAPSADHDAGG